MKLTIEHVTKRFKDKTAVKDVTLTLEEGVHALLGANGSGKTTLMRIICGVLKANEGIVRLDDIAVLSDYASFTRKLGYLPQNPGFYMDFTIDEFLSYLGVLKGLKKDFTKKKIEELLSRLHLLEVRKKKIRQLSGGMMQRVGIAQSLLNHPKLLILDEPSAGLDPKERMALRQLLATIGKDTIVILSTHIVSDVESIADDVIIMKEGEILSFENLEKTLAQLRGRVFEMKGKQEELGGIEQQYPVVNRRYEGQKLILRFLSDKEFKGAEIVEPTLDDVYLSYFKEEAYHVETDLL